MGFVGTIFSGGRFVLLKLRNLTVFQYFTHKELFQVYFYDINSCWLELSQINIVDTYIFFQIKPQFF
jgi:hypothetical protein